mmetsp:Transcript_38130/g.91579  ORF Transcript_38130/g.91579 Transcript_38130/m.91579 type:complete len:466 (+) Transcript_38130:256-1653(+)
MLVDGILRRGEGLVVAVPLQPPVNVELPGVPPRIALLLQRQRIHDIAGHPRIHPRLPPVRSQPGHVEGLRLMHALHHRDRGQHAERLADDGLQHGEVALAEIRDGKGALRGVPLKLLPVLAVHLVTQALLRLRVLRQKIHHPTDAAMRGIERPVQEPLHRGHTKRVREERGAVRLGVREQQLESVRVRGGVGVVLALLDFQSLRDGVEEGGLGVLVLLELGHPEGLEGEEPPGHAVLDAVEVVFADALPEVRGQELLAEEDFPHDVVDIRPHLLEEVHRALRPPLRGVHGEQAPGLLVHLLLDRLAVHHLSVAQAQLLGAVAVLEEEVFVPEVVQDHLRGVRPRGHLPVDEINRLGVSGGQLQVEGSDPEAEGAAVLLVVLFEKFEGESACSLQVHEVPQEPARRRAGVDALHASAPPHKAGQLHQLRPHPDLRQGLHNFHRGVKPGLHRGKDGIHGGCWEVASR